MSPRPYEYVAARRALLDALEALESHLGSIVLIGAQAVYLHCGSSSSIGVAPMTTDADLALDADLLADAPEISAALSDAGFQSGPQPGQWKNLEGIAVDLMVAPHQSGTTRSSARAARLEPHAKTVARIGSGLAPALADNAAMTIAAFEPTDRRTRVLRVAGASALLVAKTIKIRDRINDAGGGRPGRIVDKDALDILRLLQAVSTETFRSRLLRFEPGSPAAADVAIAIGVLRDHAATAESEIPILARRAANGDPTAAPSLAVLVQQLLAAVDGRYSV
jgi:hypothetical protein